MLPQNLFKGCKATVGWLQRPVKPFPSGRRRFDSFCTYVDKLSERLELAARFLTDHSEMTLTTNGQKALADLLSDIAMSAKDHEECHEENKKHDPCIGDEVGYCENEIFAGNIADSILH